MSEMRSRIVALARTAANPAKRRVAVVDGVAPVTPRTESADGRSGYVPNQLILHRYGSTGKNTKDLKDEILGDVATRVASGSPQIAPQSSCAENLGVASVNGSGSFSHSAGEGRCVDASERAAVAAHDGGVPAIYAGPFAALQLACPGRVPEQRWHQAINDAGLFLNQWGRDAERLGWQIEELFGLHDEAPMRRYDHMGLIWILHGESVTAINLDFAIVNRSLRFYRKPTAGKGRDVLLVWNATERQK